ncbi:Chemotaxis protein methyltransferase Cher2 [compost metagenome]
MAIMLYEAGLYDKARIYATDMNSESLKTAKEGIMSLAKVELYKKNYALSGGTEDFSKYYTAKYKSAIFQPFLRKNIVFAEHNLVTDSSFNEFHVILCRNVMIYFDETLRNKVHGLLHDSLGTLGVLVLGSKESIEFTPYARYYEPMHGTEKVYRKIR